MAKVTAAAGHDTFAEIDADDLMTLMAAIPGYAKRGAKWYCSPTALELVFNAIRVAAGGNSTDNLANAPSPVFLGYPIVVSPVFPDSASTDYTALAMLAFGNLAQAATVGTRREIRVALSPDRYFEQDQIAVKGTMRHDINVHDLGSTTVKSPFAVLVGGA
jgi:HK97 family phage major capsid protein